MADPFTGEIRLFAGSFAPTGWAFCNGQLLAINDYQNLFALIGTTFGGDGQSTFALPDLRGRVPMHFGQGPGLQSRTLGESGGSEQVTLTSAQMPVHTHTLMASNADGTRAAPAGNLWARSEALGFSADPPDADMHPASVSSSGGSQPHENMMPFVGLNFIIALDAIFPQPN
jgi:microcystin-dependent protein